MSPTARIYLNGKNGEGKHTTVSSCDYWRLVKGRWRLINNRNKHSTKDHWSVVRGEGKKTIYMAREILELKNSKTEADHRNGNTLDNRRENLRAVTRQGNGMNFHGPHAHNKSSHVLGVSCYTDDRCKAWRADITKNSIRWCKTFETEEEAITQRKAWERELGFGPGEG